MSKIDMQGLFRELTERMVKPRTVVIAIGYFLMAWLGQVFVIGETSVSPIWPPENPIFEPA